VKYKKFAIASALALAAIGSFLAYRAHDSESLARGQDAHGIVNPDYPATAMITEPMPELSTQRIKPRESLGAGSYTAPKPAQNDDKSNDKKVR
jgi:hypothetical protein